MSMGHWQGSHRYARYGHHGCGSRWLIAHSLLIHHCMNFVLRATDAVRDSTTPYPARGDVLSVESPVKLQSDASYTAVALTAESAISIAITPLLDHTFHVHVLDSVITKHVVR